MLNAVRTRSEEEAAETAAGEAELVQVWDAAEQMWLEEQKKEEAERKYSQEEEELKRLVGVAAERIRLEEETVKKAA